MPVFIYLFYREEERISYCKAKSCGGVGVMCERTGRGLYPGWEQSLGPRELGRLPRAQVAASSPLLSNYSTMLWRPQRGDGSKSGEGLGLSTGT